MNDIRRPNWVGSSNTKLIDLSKNVSIDSILSKKINLSLTNMDASYIMQYSDEFEVYDIICNYYNINPEMVSVGLGSTELLNRICFAFSGRRIKILSPTFEMVGVYAKIHNLDVRTVNYTEFDKISVDELIDSDILYISNPNGNNGHSFDVSDIEFILQNNNFVILDEAYIDFSKHTSCFHLLRKYSNLCILRTFSKSLGCAGIRCGFCYSSKSFTNIIQKIRINHISCGITNYILKNFIHEIDASVSRMKDTKDYMSSKYEILNDNGNFICIRNNIVDFNWCKYKSMEGYIRVTLTDKETFKKFIN